MTWNMEKKRIFATRRLVLACTLSILAIIGLVSYYFYDDLHPYTCEIVTGDVEIGHQDIETEAGTIWKWFYGDDREKYYIDLENIDKAVCEGDFISTFGDYTNVYGIGSCTITRTECKRR